MFDSKECASLADGWEVAHRQTPGRIDILFYAQRKLVGVECKLPEDLVSSHASRRLARQLREMTAIVDVRCLLLRDYDQRLVETSLGAAEERNKRYRRSTFYADMVRYQNSGITILHGPVRDDELLEYLRAVRKALGRGQSVGAFMGSDRKKKENTK